MDLTAETMNRIGRGSISLALFLLAAPVPAAPLRLTSDDAVSRAQQAHPDVATARTAIAVAEAGLQRSKAWLPANPYVSGGAGMTTQRGVGSNYGGTISQEFEIAGQRTIRAQVASQEVAKAAAALAGARLDLAAQVKTAFVDALVSFDRIDTARAGLEATNKLCTHLATRKGVSDAQRMELNNAQIQESRARRDVASS